MRAPAFVLQALQHAVAQVLRLDPEAQRQLADLDGKIIAVYLRELDMTVYVQPSADGIGLSADCAEVPDASLSAAPFTLLRLLATRDSRMLSNGEVDLRGDSASARRLMEILQNLEIDWEEQLAKITGDLPAHWFGNLLRRGGAWGRAQGEALQQSVGEYAREELRLLPSAEEMAAFLDDVDTLRADCDRLEQRIQRLETGWAGH